MTDTGREGLQNREEGFELPLMSLREVVMFPRSIVPLFVGREASIKAIESAISDYGKKIFLVAQREPELEKPGPEDLFEVGTVSKILQLLRLPDGTIKVLFEGALSRPVGRNGRCHHRCRRRLPACACDPHRAGKLRG